MQTSESLDGGRLQVAAGFSALLRENGLDTCDNVMAFPGGRVVRDFPGRRTVRLELKSPGGGTQAVFLKRYEEGYISRRRWLQRRLGFPSGADEAMGEWDNLQQVRALGINTAQPVAVGQQRHGGIVTRSFLMTAEIAGAVEGHTFFAGLPFHERRLFLHRVAQLARRFHAAGLVHKDFYLGHVLVVPGADEPALYLIDLQRVVRPCCFRERWRAKDLGALAYSALRAGASITDVMRGYVSYCETKSLDEAEKRLARRVMRRVAWLGTRRPRHDGDFDPSFQSKCR